MRTVLQAFIVILLVSSVGAFAPISRPLKVQKHQDKTQTQLALALPDLPSISDAFNAATFLPQPFWLLMIGLPNWKGTKQVMQPWWPIIGFSLLHLFIVVTSTLQPDGTAPIAEFAGVFDPAGNPQQAMVGMMKYPNFVSEEWSHVLTWDLFLGRYIWLDGLKRGIFTPHSVLLTNLIGPPGLLLHFLTCVIVGKGLPSTGDLDENSSVDADMSDFGGDTRKIAQMTAKKTVARADDLIRGVFANLYETDAEAKDDPDQFFAGVLKLSSALAEDVVWEDTADAQAIVGRQAVADKLRQRVKAASSRPGKEVYVCIDKCAEGAQSSGFTYQLIERGTTADEAVTERGGLRGTCFVSVDPETGLVNYVREIVEPLFKPGSATSKLLKAVAEAGLKKEAELRAKEGAGNAVRTTSLAYTARNPASAGDAVSYLWNEVQGSDKAEALRLFSDTIFYEDFNFNQPFIGKEQVSAFLDEFDIPGIRFNVERISEGTGTGCCFTWNVSIAGTEGATRGISYYECTGSSSSGSQISYIRDIPEPAIKPPPLQALAAVFEPGLRTFSPKVIKKN